MPTGARLLVLVEGAIRVGVAVHERAVTHPLGVGRAITRLALFRPVRGQHSPTNLAVRHRSHSFRVSGRPVPTARVP
jgi:hypothetical protein